MATVTAHPIDLEYLDGLKRRGVPDAEGRMALIDRLSAAHHALSDATEHYGESLVCQLEGHADRMDPGAAKEQLDAARDEFDEAEAEVLAYLERC